MYYELLYYDNQRKRRKREHCSLYQENEKCFVSYKIRIRISVCRTNTPFFSIHKGLTFPDVVDASDLFKRITEFTPLKTTTSAASASAAAFASAAALPVALQTHAFPYKNTALYYLRPGSILFWKYRKPNYPYGHVALIWKNDPTTNETYVVQQNLNPPIKRYNTDVLFSKMNCANSKFAGVKLLPREYLTGIQNLECIVHRL